LRQIWKDPRLAWESDVQSSLTIGVDMVKSIWTPDTFFPNEKKSFFHEATSHNSFLRIDIPTGHPGMLTRNRVHSRSGEIVSYGYSTRDIVYHWHGLRAVVIDENVHLAHFSIANHRYVERIISLSTGNYSRLSVYFTFKRNIGFYLIQIYLPSSLIVVISWVSFWLNREAVQARVAIVFASLLEYAAIGYLMKQKQLKASPVQYHETSDGILERENAWQDVENGRGRRVQIKIEPRTDQSIPLLSVVPSVSYTSKPAWMSIRPSQVDLFSRFAFPAFFLLFHLVYWGFYLNI
uniref:Neur_chan_LBD domain-containing protein n=1 Tax=Angiostrongylus cantonensis TaxID=6313 RepID=A0A158P779_ANGCA